MVYYVNHFPLSCNNLLFKNCLDRNAVVPCTIPWVVELNCGTLKTYKKYISLYGLKCIGMGF